MTTRKNAIVIHIPTTNELNPRSLGNKIVEKLLKANFLQIVYELQVHGQKMGLP